MANVASPLVIDPSSNTQNEEDLLSRLDTLWESYLGMLDQYRAAQAELSKHLSSVHKAHIITIEESNSRSVTITSPSNTASADRRASNTRTVTGYHDMKSSIGTTLEGSENQGASEKTQTASDVPSTPIQIQDPLRWFGILVPPALRSAQSSFVAGVEGPVAELAAAQKGMWELEIEIRKARKVLRKAGKFQSR
ncbi:MAG: hypothetical protein M1820_003719 [Bogoriella megaspora]|nr:MAG: hypothetical protein M1820_003719 [Bogoriella megaspora]